MPINPLLQTLEKNIRLLFDGKSPDTLYNPMYFPLEAGGKRLRPQLCLMSAEAVGGNPETALHAATALELLHTFTLVHDDIMDHDDMRRGRPTVHKKWNAPTAILAGDGLVTMAYHSLLKTEHPDMIKILRLFTEGLLILCEGQALDKEFEQRDDVTLDEYLEMIDKKTGKLIEVSCEIGAILGGGSQEEVHAIREFAARIGRAFQVQDDYLDIAKDTGITGKPMGSDLLEKKKTFLTIHFLNHASDAHKYKFLEHWHQSKMDETDVASIRKLFIESGTMEATRSHFFQLTDEALDYLNVLDENERRKSLVGLAIKIRDRIS